MAISRPPKNRAQTPFTETTSAGSSTHKPAKYWKSLTFSFFRSGLQSYARFSCAFVYNRHPLLPIRGTDTLLVELSENDFGVGIVSSSPQSYCSQSVEALSLEKVKRPLARP